MELDPRLLKILVVVMRTGSVTRAAEELNTSQPSISKAIQRLESIVGFPLFERRGRSIHPTPKAQWLREDTQRLERELEAIHRSVIEIRNERRSGFRVASIPGFATTLLPDVVKQFTERYGNCTFQIELWRRERILSEFDAGRVDIAMIHSSSENVPLGYRIVANAPLKCFMPAGHKLTRKEVVCLQDLAGEKLVLYHSSLDFADSLWRALKLVTPAPKIDIEVSQTGLLRELVRRGVGISLLDGFTAYGDPMTDLAIRPFHPSFPYYLAVANSGVRMNAEARDFLALLRSSAQAMGV